MQTRHRKGTYTAHNTPGDGTGFSKCPEDEYFGDILHDADLAHHDGTDFTDPQQFPSQVTEDHKE